MSVAVAAAKSLLLMGRCAPSVKQNASKIVVKKLELDQNLLMVSGKLVYTLYFDAFNTPLNLVCFQYFNKDKVYYAHDPEQLCKTGDVVLIQELPEKLTTHITHKVLKVVYPLGDVTDPISNKKVAALRCGTVCYRFVHLENNVWCSFVLFTFCRVEASTYLIIIRREPLCDSKKYKMCKIVFMDTTYKIRF